jgi:hypothetical protein
MPPLKRISVAQAIGVLLVLGGLSALFIFWVPLAQKSVTSESLLKCNVAKNEPNKLYLHQPNSLTNFKNPDLSKGCAGQVLVYKLFL